jgi:hypothetical protein
MQYRVIITVDANDGDYVESINIVTAERKQVLEAVAQALLQFEPYQGKEIVPDFHYECTHNFVHGEMIRDDLGELSAREYYVEKHELLTAEQYQTFMDLCPYCEYGFHTVESIELLEVQNNVKLF